MSAGGLARVLAVLPPEAAQRARDLLGAEAGTPVACADKLLASPDTEVRLVALGLLLVAGEQARARALLEQHGDAWLDSGAPLWPLLAGEHAPALARWRIPAALSAGVAPAADEQVVVSADRQERLEAARWLYLGGRFAEAAELAEPLATGAEADDAGYLAVRALDALGEHARIAEVTARWRPRAGEPEVRHAAYRASACIALGQLDEARALVPRLVRPATREARERAVRVLMQLGELRAALSVIDGLLDVAREPPSPRLMLMAGIACFDGGRLGDARRWLADLGACPPALALPAAAMDAWCQLALGELDGLDARLAALAAAAGERQAHWPRLWLAIVGEWLALYRGEPPGEPIVAEGTEVHLLAAVRHWRRVRAGLAADAVRAPRLVTPDLVALRLLAEAHGELLSGHPIAAAELAGRASETARRAGFALIEGECLIVEAEVACVAGHARRLGAAATALRKLAARTGSRRLAADAELVRGLLQPEPPALLDDASPMATRRARALRGEPALLDRVDQLLVAAERTPRPRRRPPP